MPSSHPADALGKAKTGPQEHRDVDQADNQPIKLGEILVEQGVLSEQQVFEILQAQKDLKLPFGVLAERMFDVTIDSIEQAWIEQYHRYTGTLNLDEVAVDDEALRVINRRQAHQFEILPIGFEPGGELLMAATRTRLARAVTFAASQIDRVTYFRVAERPQLMAFLQEHYPMPEVTDSLLDRARRLAG